MNAIDSLYFFRSELFLTTAILVLLVLDFIMKKKNLLGWLSLAALVIAVLMPPPFYPDEALFFGQYHWDPLTYFFRNIAYFAVGLTILISLVYEKIPENYRGEFYILILALAPLLTIMGGIANLLMIFLLIESVSVTSYLLVGFQKHDKRSSEASVKYVLFGSVSSAVMLYGMSLLFGATGTIELSKMAVALHSASAPLQGTIILAMLLFLVGIGFKISMVPFHMWAPDVYQGAPTPVTAFLTVAPKALGFAVLIRVLYLAFPGLSNNWSHLFGVLAILTMTIGNIIAISQTDVKRLLAYSSIAQAGYILVGFAQRSSLGLQAVLIYTTAYLFTNLGAFFTVLAIERNLGSNEIETYEGLSKRAPLLALALTIFLLSIAGIPPLAGFIGKIFIFSAAIQAKLMPIALAIALNSALAAYYYFKIVKAMYLSSKSVPLHPFVNPLPIKIAVTATLLGTILIGLYPNQLLRIVEQSIAIFQY